MQSRKIFSAVAKGAAAVAAFGMVAGVVITATHFDRANTRFANCLAQQTGGESNRLLGTVTDIEGTVVYIDPILRPYGTDLLGRRAGAIIPKVENGINTLSVVFEKGAEGAQAYTAKVDYMRLAGKPVFSGTWGRGDILPNMRQQQLASYALHCANTDWVLHR